MSASGVNWYQTAWLSPQYVSSSCSVAPVVSTAPEANGRLSIAGDPIQSSVGGASATTGSGPANGISRPASINAPVTGTTKRRAPFIGNLPRAGDIGNQARLTGRGRLGRLGPSRRMAAGPFRRVSALAGDSTPITRAQVQSLHPQPRMPPDQNTAKCQTAPIPSDLHTVAPEGNAIETACRLSRLRGKAPGRSWATVPVR